MSVHVFAAAAASAVDQAGISGNHSATPALPPAWCGQNAPSGPYRLPTPRALSVCSVCSTQVVQMGHETPRQLCGCTAMSASVCMYVCMCVCLSVCHGCVWTLWSMMVFIELYPVVEVSLLHYLSPVTCVLVVQVCRVRNCGLVVCNTGSSLFYDICWMRPWLFFFRDYLLYIYHLSSDTNCCPLYPSVVLVT